MNKKKLVSSILALVFVLGLFFVNSVLDKFLPESGDTGLTQESTGVTDPADTQKPTEAQKPTDAPQPGGTGTLDKNGTYTTKEDVALYIHLYGELPSNFITKDEARDLGWEGGGLEDYAPGKCIGGDRFGNYEGLRPKAPGRTWTECDIDTLGKSSRGAKRIVFSNDGLIFYTDDHYESFTQLYGEE